MAEEKKVNVEETEKVTVNTEAEGQPVENQAPAEDDVTVEKKKFTLPKWLVMAGKIAEGVAAGFGTVVAIFLIKDSLDSKKQKQAYIDAPAHPAELPTMQNIINDGPVSEAMDLTEI